MKSSACHSQTAIYKCVSTTKSRCLLSAFDCKHELIVTIVNMVSSNAAKQAHEFNK